ncbi:MAG: RNA polymerase sigma factor [Planctomycetota bacterium]
MEPEPLVAIVARAMTGSDSAFERLHQRLAGGLRRFIADRLGPGDAAAVDELTQETWVVVWRALTDHRYDPARAAFTTFLYAVGYKVFLRYLRQRRRPLAGAIGRLQDAGDDLADPALQDPADWLDHCELLDRLAAVLESARQGGELTPEELTLADSVAAGEAERAIAARLGVAPSTLHERKKQLMSKLRRRLAARSRDRESSEHPADSGE